MENIITNFSIFFNSVIAEIRSVLHYE